MSKIAEKKALEEYPFEPIECGGGIADSNSEYRGLYQEGYDQAMQDIEEFFQENFYIHPHDCHVVQYVSEQPLESIDNFVEQIKNYIEKGGGEQ